MPEEVDFEVTGIPVEEDLYFNKLESEAYDIWALTPAGIKAAEESELEVAAAFIAWLVFWVVPKSLGEEMDGKAGWITAGIWLSVFAIGPFLIFGVFG